MDVMWCWWWWWKVSCICHFEQRCRRPPQTANTESWLILNKNVHSMDIVKWLNFDSDELQRSKWFAIVWNWNITWYRMYINPSPFTQIDSISLYIPLECGSVANDDDRPFHVNRIIGYNIDLSLHLEKWMDFLCHTSFTSSDINTRCKCQVLPRYTEICFF